MERSYSSNCENGYFRARNTASKNPAVSALQDLLFYQLTGIAFYAKNILYFQKNDRDTDNRISRLLYLTNKGINFSVTTMVNAINEAYNLKNKEENIYRILDKTNNQKEKKFPVSSSFHPGNSLSQLVSQANVINAQKSIKNANINILAMQEIIRQSITSCANYIERIKSINGVPNNIYSVLYDLLNFLNNNDTNLSYCENYALIAGELQIQILELLLQSYEKEYGLIEQKEVSCDYKKGNAILVAGEDIPFLKKLLEDTKDKSINIYTYGDMNLVHTFPQINKYENLTGIYTGKYNNFATDIEGFPGIVVITNGNLEELTDIYRGRIFSTEEISMLGISKIKRHDTKTLINAAYDAQGFSKDIKNSPINMGFGQKDFENYEKNILSEFRKKKIKNVIIFIGCNYINGDKKYYNKLIKTISKDTAIVTLDCLSSSKNCNIKQPFYKFDFGLYLNLYNLVRLLFSIAGKEHKDINDMPIEIIIDLKTPNSIAALLMFLALGFKNLKINSSLPYYLTESLLRTFSKKYGLSKAESSNNDVNDIKFKKLQ